MAQLSGNLTLGAASMTNAGTISGGSAVTLNTGSLNNNGGTVSAANTINVNNNGNLNINGGNLLSQTLNLNAGTGALTVINTNITGIVNDTAAAAHIDATRKTFFLALQT